MNNITKYNIKVVVIATVAVLLLLSFCNYISAPESDSLLEAMNPYPVLAGIAFVLSYMGAPIFISILATVLLVAIVWFLFLILARNIVK